MPTENDFRDAAAPIPGFYDRRIDGLVAMMGSAPTIGARGRPTFRRNRDGSSTLGSLDRDEIGQPTPAGYGRVAGVLFVSDPTITIAGTTTTSPVGLPPGRGASPSISENFRFEAEIGRSVPIDSGTHFGRNAEACDDDPLACHGEVTSDEFFAVLGFVPVVGEVIDSAFCAGGDNVSCASIIVPFAGGKAVRLTADSFRSGSRATDGFRITNKRWKHITDRHVAGGRRPTPTKSLWDSEDDILAYIGNARTCAPSATDRDGARASRLHRHHGRLNARSTVTRVAMPDTMSRFCASHAQVRDSDGRHRRSA